MNETSSELDRTAARSRPTAARHRRGLSLGWILALIAAIVVVVLAVMLIQANRQAGSVQDQADRQVQELQTQLRASEARARLNSLKAAIRADVDEEVLQSQYETIRGDLEAAYRDAEGRTAETWRDLEQGLDELGTAIGESTEDAVASIDAMLDTLGRNAASP